MTICLILFVLLHDLVFLLYTLLENIFFNWFCFAGHCTLVAYNFVGFNQKSISRDLHSSLNFDNVSNKNKILMDLNEFTISENSDNFFLFFLFVELHKLSFLLIIVYGSDKGRNEDSHQDSESLNPGSVPFV